jgi:hypothetical protein
VEAADAQVDIRERNEFQTPYGRAIGVSETVILAGLRVTLTRAMPLN